MADCGVRWFPVEVDLVDDDGVSDLMWSYEDDGALAALAASGMWVLLLAEVYREGPYAEWSERKARKLARRVGMGAEWVSDFVSRAASCGLLDRGLLEGRGVVTSHGIQRRWLRAKRSNHRRAIADGLDPSLLYGDVRDELGMGDGGDVAAQCGDVAAQCGDRREERREEEKKEKEKRDEREARPSAREEGEDRGASEAAVILPCMSQRVEGRTYLDADGTMHRTQVGALAARYAHQVGRSDFPAFCGRVRGLCPQSCRGEPERAGACYELLSKALDRYDPERARDPFGIARTVLTQDRG